MMLSTTETGYETQEAQINISYETSGVPEGITLALKDQSTGELYFLDGTSIEAIIPAKGGLGILKVTIQIILKWEMHSSDYMYASDGLCRAGNYS